MSIPIGQIVRVNPAVLSAAGSAIDLNGLILSQSAYSPIGAAVPFANKDDVAAYYGVNSVEASMAAIYFKGPNNKTKTPGKLYFAQYPAAAVAAWLQGASLAALTLAQLQALGSGTIALTVDGVAKNSSSINLAAIGSFSAAASAIQSAFTGVSCVYDSIKSAFILTSASVGAGAVFTGAIASSTLTVSAVTSGTLRVGQTISGTGVTAGTTITALGTGTGGAGTYTVSTSQTVASTTISSAPSSITAATANAFTTGLGLTAAAGATTSQGAEAGSPNAFMSNLVTTVTQNWALFTSTWEPLLADKKNFSAWTDAQNNRFGYVGWDTDVNAKVANSTTTWGAYLKNTDSSGSVPVFGDQTHAAFVLGFAASLDFDRLNGRATLAFKGQSGLTPYVTDATAASNLKANGYNFYGAYATAKDQFNFFYAGAISGDFAWLDTFLDQIWLNANLQLSIITLLMNVNSIPYNSDGYAMVEASCLDPINAGLNFGAIRIGTTLSEEQKAIIQNALGFDGSQAIISKGYILQIVPATAQVRAARASPPMTLYYADGGSIQAIEMASIAIQ
jgi:hypothetical protein